MKEWKKPTIVLLNNNINSGGTGVTYVENLYACAVITTPTPAPGTGKSTVDQYASFPSFGSVISPFVATPGGAPSMGYGSTQCAFYGFCS